MVAKRSAARASAARRTTGKAAARIPVVPAVKRAASPTRRAGRGSSAARGAGVRVSLPAGTARLFIEGKATVRRTAREWLRLVQALAGADLSPTVLLDELRGELTPDGPGLTGDEKAELTAAGASPASPAAVTAARTERVGWRLHAAAAALNVASAAEQMGVDPTRVRQRLREGSLYGLRAGGRTWRLPGWQFGPDGHPLPHLGVVLPVLPAGLHPRSVEGFFLTPLPELVADGAVLCPRDWLLSDGPPEPVAALAGSLAAA